MLLPGSEQSPRPPIRRPSPTSDSAYVCPRCDLILHDGTAYEVCPACNALVDWVDLRLPVWACPTCDALVNSDVAPPPWCGRCDRALRRLRSYERPSLPGEEHTSLVRLLERATSTPVGVGVVQVLSALPALSMSLHPQWRALGIGWFLPVMLVPSLLAVFVLGAIANSTTELRELRRDRRTRVIHGIEHTTVNLLERRGFRLRGGLTEHGLFNLWVLSERPRGSKRYLDRGGADAVRRACNFAIRLLRRGNTRFAFDRRCGTTWLTEFILGEIGILAALVIGVVAHLDARGLMILLTAQFLLLAVGSRPIGWALQRLLTVSTRFERARVTRVQRRVESDAAIRFIVHLRVETEPTARERRWRTRRRSRISGQTSS